MASDRDDEFKDRQAALLEEFSDCFVQATDLPALREWVVVACFDDATDARGGGSRYICGRNQFTHSIIGLLSLALSDCERQAFERDDE